MVKVGKTTGKKKKYDAYEKSVYDANNARNRCAYSVSKSNKMLKDASNFPMRSNTDQNEVMHDMLYMSEKWLKVLKNPNCTRVLLDIIREEKDPSTIKEAIHLYMYYRDIKEEKLESWIKEKLAKNKGE